MCVQPRSATAAMVRDGLAPTGPGSSAPSITYRPGWPNTSPYSSHSPSPACRPMGAPPSGCTVITRFAHHSGLSAYVPPSWPAIARMLARTPSK